MGVVDDGGVDGEYDTAVESNVVDGVERVGEAVEDSSLAVELEAALAAEVNGEWGVNWASRSFRE